MRLALAQFRVREVAGVAGFAAHLDELAAQAAAGGADLLVLPEYAAVEAGVGVDLADELRVICGATEALLEVMRLAAVREKIWLVPGSLPMLLDGKIINRAPLIAPDGSMRFQDKRVMTRFEAELWGISPGAAPGVFETPWGRIGIAICYDVEFPGLVRAQAEAGAWLVLVPCCTDTMAGFNRVRLAARARALENQFFVAIAPTVGRAPWLATLDENRGYAAVFGPVDRGFPEDGVMARGALDVEQIVFCALDPGGLVAVREHGAVRNFRDWP